MIFTESLGNGNYMASYERSIFLDVEAEVIAGGVVEVLADAQVAFRGQDGGVAQGELNLLEGGAAFVGQFGEGSSQIVRRRLDPQLLA